MHKFIPAAFILACATSVLLLLLPGIAHASAEVGATVRNGFGPDVGLSANQCRGACGGGCPRTCSIEVLYECEGESQLRRVEAFTCGTHQGCREHDDCLDTCLLSKSGAKECQQKCDAMVMQNYGFENATPWLLGKGPYDGEITFEYTHRAPDDPEPLYRCPPGATRQCGESAACIESDGGRVVDAIFDVYPSVNADAMHISGLRAGPLCSGEERVCEQALSIPVSGDSSCARGPCTRFGMEFEYRNASPGMPLECKTSTRSSEGDFIGDLVKLGGDAIAERDAASGGPAPDDGMGQLLGMFAKVIASADSPEDVQISMTPLDEEGNPDESRRVGSHSDGTPPPIPASVVVPNESGRLVIPMYQLASSSKPGTVKERRVTCTHEGEPVLETVFVLKH